jgi:hypothetical protein
MTATCCLVRDSPNLEGQVPIFISSRNRVAQIYLRALGSLFVASYDSRGYSGGILSGLHTGQRILNNLTFLLYPQALGLLKVINGLLINIIKP